MSIKTTTKYYLRRVKAKSLDEVNFNQLQKIFLLSIYSFQNEEITLEDLSNISSNIWPEPLETDLKEEAELKDVIHSCAEINFYLRNIIRADEDGSAFLSYLLDTLNYYKKNKDIIS